MNKIYSIGGFMKILIIGAGTIGISYGWLLSSKNDVTFFIKEENRSRYQNGVEMHINDLRKDCESTIIKYKLKTTTMIDDDYDTIIVTVNRNQLSGVLPLLSKKAKTADIIFMLNHWDIESEINQYLNTENYFVGFPSQIGGGRLKNKLHITVFEQGTILGNPKRKDTSRILYYKAVFEGAGLTVEIREDIFDWLKVHYLQQSLSAGAILKAGNYDLLTDSYTSVKEMIYAFREGLAVCEAEGVKTKKIFPAKLFYYPAPLITMMLKSMLRKSTTRDMIKGHMMHGLDEWITGYYEVLESGKKNAIDMSIWESYRIYVDTYMNPNR